MTKFGSVRGLAIQHLFPKFGELNFGPGVPRHHATTCISPSLMHLFIIRPHRIRSTTYLDAAYCYRLISVVCLSVCRSVCHSCELCKHGCTDRDAI